MLYASNQLRILAMPFHCLPTQRVPALTLMVACAAAVQLRLDGGTAASGRLMIQYAGVWGTVSRLKAAMLTCNKNPGFIACLGLSSVQVCKDKFSNEAMTVACRQLGFAGPGKLEPSTTFGPGSGPILLDDVTCSGTEASLADCRHRGWGVHNW